ncbi:hypothetical protein WMY93_029660 [Mugilogobius chulae]|uniref:Serpin B6 n=1 Tax=Mugilogobius chulae TaxID=88201 RepID=A0AAW0MPZ4_9GOBI
MKLHLFGAGRFLIIKTGGSDYRVPAIPLNTAVVGDNDRTSNVFFSPLSISSALAMVLFGPEETRPRRCQRIFWRHKKHYNAELQTVDFAKRFEEARVTINTWVEQQTQEKIKDLLAQGVLDSLTKLVLVNAIYFKGKWDKQFNESATRDHDFRINKSQTKKVKMMHLKSKFPLTYIGDISCQVIALPYKGNELSMLIFLPTDIEDGTTGLEKLEKQLTYENFAEWTRPDMMDEVEVQVGLPRFKLEETCDMKNILMSMGMVDAFDLAASDFSGMSPANDLVVSKVVHKAFVEVNEEGTEAAAATAVVMMLRCAPMIRPAAFIADHPFLFFIRHNKTKAILFAGRYCSPSNLDICHLPYVLDCHSNW